MQKNLVIVESPAKAKTIEKFLGKDYKVLSSYGHIRDLKKKEFSIDIDKDFKPHYEIPGDKKKVVEELKAEAKEAETVWLASDEDREGEAIAWHLYEVLKLQPEHTKRIVFHEITQSAILKAIEQPRNIDINLVDAQQARRILDRIVGFELSPVLWKKVKPALSAGRVQSVAVRLIVEREREIQAFQSEASYRVTAVFLVPDADGKPVEMKAELSRRIKTKAEAQKFLESCRSASFTIHDISTRPLKKSPAAPFTTSTLQQEDVVKGAAGLFFSGRSFHYIYLAAGSCPQIRIYSSTDHDGSPAVVRIGKDNLYAYRLRQPVRTGGQQQQSGHCRHDGRTLCISASFRHQNQRRSRGSRSHSPYVYGKCQDRRYAAGKKTVRPDMEAHDSLSNGRCGS